MSDWPIYVGGGLLLLLAGGRRRRPPPTSTDIVSHDLPMQNRLAVDVRIEDAEGHVLLDARDVPSGGVIGAPNRTVPLTESESDVDEAEPRGEATITIGEITVEPVTTNGGPPPQTNTSGESRPPFSGPALRLAARKFMDAWAANGKRPLGAASLYLVSAVQRAATNLTVDGRYGPRTAGAVKWALGTFAPPWSPTGTPVTWSPPR